MGNYWAFRQNNSYSILINNRKTKCVCVCIKFCHNVAQINSFKEIQNAAVLGATDACVLAEKTTHCFLISSNAERSFNMTGHIILEC